jgi:hypothetical protein
MNGFVAGIKRINLCFRGDDFDREKTEINSMGGFPGIC